VLKEGFVDLYRHLYPTEKDCYTYWGYRFQARAKNKGWRLDYYVASPGLLERLDDVTVAKTILGSDHVPLILTLVDANSPAVEDSEKVEPAEE
jgi:exodeoxyribonuclease-3